jgi:hypothetical protein
VSATARPILARADLERFDPQAPRRRGRYRVCCPLCGAGKPVDAAHRSLTVTNDADGLWYCHRCALGGQLREHWPERERSADRRQRVTAWAAWAFGKPATSAPPPTIVAFADPHAIARTRTRDPRPDLEANAALWAELLAVARDLEPALPLGLYGALLRARCIGVQLTAGDHRSARKGAETERPRAIARADAALE